MKTLHTNPQFQNQPLRLDEAQTQYPEAALDEFFQSYHLCNVRPILWQWLKEVLTSPRESINDPHERSNDLFFYEKVESLIEAAWVMRRRYVPTPNLVGNTNNKREALLAMNQPTKCQLPIQSNIHRGEHDKASRPTHPSKPPRLIEKATSQPIEVINDVFDQVSLGDLTDNLLPNWLRVAVMNTQSPYSDENGRELLYEFYEQLTAFITQLHIASENRQLTNFTGFFHQYHINYLRRELADFLEAGISHVDEFPNGFSPWQAFMVYNHVLCLVEAAYRLYTDQQSQCVLNTSIQ